jgi:hypothetical protein
VPFSRPEKTVSAIATTASLPFIAHDWCGWNNRFGRFTACPLGQTLVCQEWMGQEDWDYAQLMFLRRFPGLPVHSCPGVYTTAGTRLMGTTDEICRRLESRLLELGPVFLWRKLRDIPVTEDGVYLDADFFTFRKGDEKEDVWHWFERTFPGFSVAEAQGHRL